MNENIFIEIKQWINEAEAIVVGAGYRLASTDNPITTTK